MSHISAQEAEEGVGSDVPDHSPRKSVRRQMLEEFWFYFSENKGAVLGLVVFVLIIMTALAAPLIAPHSPFITNNAAQLLPPVWQEGGSWSYLLGTDAIGRDMLSRLLFGAQYSLFIGVVFVVFAVSSGISVGLIAG